MLAFDKLGSGEMLNELTAKGTGMGSTARYFVGMGPVTKGFDFSEALLAVEKKAQANHAVYWSEES